MIQLKLLSGKQAGSTLVARRFPFQIGRAQESDLIIEEPGVWDKHLVIRFEQDNGFIAAPIGDALVTVNGESIRSALLRNGDSIMIGAMRLQFWLSETTQSAFRTREGIVWTGIILVSLAQIGLIYLLIR